MNFCSDVSVSDRFNPDPDYGTDYGTKVVRRTKTPVSTIHVLRNEPWHDQRSVCRLGRYKRRRHREGGQKCSQMGAASICVSGPSGSKSWVYRFALEGKLRDMGLGPYPDISLAEARERAMAQRKMRLDGRDPIEARNASRVAARLNAAKPMTFAECAEAYIAAHRAGWRNSKHAAQWTATLVTYVNPVFGELPVHTVDVGRHEGDRADLDDEARDGISRPRPD